MKLPIRLRFPFPEPADTGRSLGMKPAEIRKVLAMADALAAKQKPVANGRVPSSGTQVEAAIRFQRADGQHEQDDVTR